MTRRQYLALLGSVFAVELLRTAWMMLAVSIAASLVAFVTARVP